MQKSNADRNSPRSRNLALAVSAGLLVVTTALTGCGSTSKSSAAEPQPSSSAAAPAAPVADTASKAAQPAAPAAPPAKAPAAPAAPPAPKVGVPFTVNMRNGNIAKITIVSAVYTQSVTTGPFNTPAKKGGYLLLDVLWETEAGKTSSNPMYFTAKDSAGRKGEMELFADDTLTSGDVVAGDKARGFVAFDIAPGPVTVAVTDPLLQEAARIQITP